MDSPVLPPETLEGWYALHQIFAVDRRALRNADPQARERAIGEAVAVLERMVPGEGGAGGEGWSAVVPLVGSTADVLLLHFRESLEALGAAEQEVKRLRLAEFLRPTRSFLSVTEAGLYHVTAQLARQAAERQGEVGDEAYQRALEERRAAERESAHVRRRLYPEPPPDMPWVCFYPMSKKRQDGQNWYALGLEERSRLMYAHGMTGRRYAGRVVQVITGAIGLDDWEWGVTLFARDPLTFKKLVTEMRFDEVSARYAEFGDFHVGRLTPPAEWLASLAA